MLSDAGVVRSDEPHSPRFDRLEALRGVAHHEHGLSQTRGFFLYSAGIRQDECGTGHQCDKGQVIEWFDQVDVSVEVSITSEEAANGIAHVWIQMHRIHEGDVSESPGKGGNGLADFFESAPEALTPMAGDQHHAGAAA